MSKDVIPIQKVRVYENKYGFVIGLRWISDWDVIESITPKVSDSLYKPPGSGPCIHFSWVEIEYRHFCDQI